MTASRDAFKTRTPIDPPLAGAVSGITFIRRIPQEMCHW